MGTKKEIDSTEQQPTTVTVEIPTINGLTHPKLDDKFIPDSKVTPKRYSPLLRQVSPKKKKIIKVLK